jgi:predicted alpha/beta hydrolase family esterase
MTHCLTPPTMWWLSDSSHYVMTDWLLPLCDDWLTPPTMWWLTDFSHYVMTDWLFPLCDDWLPDISQYVMTDSSHYVMTNYSHHVMTDWLFPLCDDWLPDISQCLMTDSSHYMITNSSHYVMTNSSHYVMTDWLLPLCDDWLTLPTISYWCTFKQGHQALKAVNVNSTGSRVAHHIKSASTEVEAVSETQGISSFLTCLIAWEDFTAFSCHEGFKHKLGYVIYYDHSGIGTVIFWNTGTPPLLLKWCIPLTQFLHFHSSMGGMLSSAAYRNISYA